MHMRHRIGRRSAVAIACTLSIAGCSSSPLDDSNEFRETTQPIESGARTISGDVERYDYTVDLASRAVQTQLGVRVETGGRCFSSDCDLPVSQTTWDDAPATSELSDGKLLVCGSSKRRGERLELGARAEVPEQTFLGLDVGFSRKKDLAGGTFTYLLSWVEGCSHFGPCDSDPGRLAEFHFDVTHAPGEVVLCPGRLSAGDTRTRCDVSRWGGARAPTYSTVAVASDPLWQRAPFLTTRSGLNVVFYEVPGGRLAASLDKASVGRFLDWVTALLGPFPYGDELRFAGAPTRWSGFEHPANVILNEKLPSAQSSYADVTMHVLMHEIVHQWAGDRTTLAAVHDFVWKEATAEYLSYVFEREHRPAGEADKTRAYWDRIALLATHHPRPIDQPPPAVQDFYRDVYGPGPMVLYVQLEDLLGRDTVLDGIRLFLARPGARSVRDLKRAMEFVSGEDLSAYFDAWVFGAGKPSWPTFSVATSPDGHGNVEVTVTQQSADGRLRGCLVEVEVESSTGAKVLARVDFGLRPRTNRASTTISLEGAVAGAVIDPRHRVIHRDAAAPSADFAEVTEEDILIF